ncbi:ATP-binding protein [Aureispira anguillae]|uniref:histidine kinase n=1 Tax=Aureispira anguillae TaxID=2864201 RepID=A0A916DWF2_9BACT|nr:tetratricopeptide repeat-containing sensor histidine kinase [Aureispira anguillae]BDS14620.1 tetratricopeptide repeat-containing sensor histidine kinase [Aureispira anguillae]
MNRTVLYCFLTLLLLGAGMEPTTAQTLESWYQRYRKLPNNDIAYYEERIGLLDSIIGKEIHQEVELVLPLIDTLAFLHQRLGHKARCNHTRYKTKGFMYAIRENYLEALNYYQKYSESETFRKESVDDGYFLLDVGNLYYDLKLYNLAKTYYQDAEQVFKNKENYRGLGTINSNYCLVAQELGQIDSALHYVQKALSLQENMVKDSFQIAYTYQVIGRLYSEHKHNYPKAIANFQKTISLLSNEDLKEDFGYNQFIRYLPQTYMRLGQVYYALNEVDSGYFYLHKALEKVKAIHQDHVFIYIGTESGKTWLEQGQLKEAEDLLLATEKLAEANGNDKGLERCYAYLKQIYTQKEDYKKAIYYAAKYEVSRNFFQEEEKRLFLINEQLLQQEKNQRILKQEQTIVAEQRLRIQLYGILVLVVIILFLLIGFWWKLRRQNKEIERYAKKLENSNKVKEIILAVIGHDLRTPFNVISTNVSLILRNLNDKRAVALNKSIAQVDLAARKAYVMMDGLMQWVTLNKEEVSLKKKKRIVLDVLVNKVLNELDALIEVGGLVVKKEVDFIQLNTGANLLQIVLRNLLTNAIKNTPFSGEICIRTLLNKEGCLLQVEDSGLGIPEEQLEHLFASIDVIHVAQKGSGLGLKIVKELCDELSIEIRAFNREGGGAVFELQIPDRDICRSEMVAHNVDNNTPSITQQKLTTNEKQFLKPYITQLLAHEVFEGTAIRAIVETIKQQSRKTTVMTWVTELEQVVFLNDEHTYKEFLKESVSDAK